MTQAPNVLPRGRHAAPREIVRQSQNERMLGAMADAVAEKGYGRAAYDAGADMLLGAIAESVADSLGDWQAAMRTGVRAYLETLAANPAFARTFMHEVLAAGPAALARRTVIMDRFIDQLVVLTEAARAAAPEVPHHPRYVYEASVGASNELVARKLLQDGPQRLPEIADALVDVQLKLLGPRG
jgi:hypothetical protein